MLQRILNFLQAILQALHPARFFYDEQATQQIVRDQDARILHPVSTRVEELHETDPALIMPLTARERTTEPYRALVRLKHPMQRYRDLDAMLENCKRDRLNTVETALVPSQLHELARQLQRKIEQENRK
jgi:hypothetical protein